MGDAECSRCFPASSLSLHCTVFAETHFPSHWHPNNRMWGEKKRDNIFPLGGGEDSAEVAPSAPTCRVNAE